jgi:hypothetical protein
LGSSLAVAAVLGAWGCNADEEPQGLVEDGAAGAGGSGGESADASAGASGSATGGTAGTGGAPGAGGTAGAGGAAGGALDAGSDAPSSSEAGDASDAGSKSYGFAVGADYATGSVKWVAVDWATKQSAGSSVFPNVGGTDAVPAVSGGRAFMLERSDGRLVTFQKDKPWLADKTIDLGPPEAGAYGLNPVAVVSTGAKAYVPMLSTNRIAIVDVDAGSLTGQVDLSAFVDPSDSDGLVDVFDGAYDAATHRAYFLLLEIPQLEKGIEPDRASHCIAAAPIVVAVDTTTDQLVDLNGDASGQGIALLGRNPTALVPDLARGRLLVVHAGCYQTEGGDLSDAGPDAQAGAPRVGRGVESFSLATGASTWLYSHAEPTRLSGLVVIDATRAFLSADDAFYTTHWYPWDPSNGATHGAEALAMPELAPHFVGGNAIVGLAAVDVDGGMLNAFVSFDVGASTASTIVPDIFGSTDYSGQYNGWAFLP